MGDPNVERPSFANHPQHVYEMIRAALAASDAQAAVERHLRRGSERILLIGPPGNATPVNLDTSRIFLVAVGKAAVPMARGALKVLGDDLTAGITITKKGERDWQAETAAWPIPVLEGGHPLTDEASLQATQAVVEMLNQTASDDVVLCLISGGTSALLSQPLLPLKDFRGLVGMLQNSGCTINELNTLRRALDRIKAGGLARLAQPATTHSLILSDVIGNPLRDIGSGPTVFTRDRVTDIASVLGKYDVARRVEREEWQRLAEALKEVSRFRSTELPAPVVYNHLIGDVSLAATGAQVRAIQLGYLAQLLTVHMEGEAREMGRLAAAIGRDTPPNHCYILGGETTVTVSGSGRGGRNLEVALAAALALEEIPRVVVASFATDGDDGRTPVAGAIITGETAMQARAYGLDPRAYLEANDSYTFFSELDKQRKRNTPPHLIKTGLTGTNVNDVLMILTYER